MTNVEGLKTWWSDNSWMMEDHWDEYLELGGLIKSLADEEKDREDRVFDEVFSGPSRTLPPTRRNIVIPEQGPTDPSVVFPEPPFLGPESPVPPSTLFRKKLDPLPYVMFYGTAMEERFSINDPGRAYGFFKPRPEFDQSRDRYGNTRPGPGL